MTNLFLIGLLLALLAIHVPVAVAFGLAAAFFLAIATEVPLVTARRRAVRGARRHPRAGGDPVPRVLDSRYRGDDERA